MDLKLSDKLALVTGSTAGIGLAIARGLAREGARVVVNGRTGERVKEAVAAIRSVVPKAKLESLPADLSSAKGAAAATSRFPDVEILVNNLGAYQPKPFEEITDADWQAAIETNFMSGVR